jgi:DNA-binding Lrp family transcriptional regulator
MQQQRVRKSRKISTLGPQETKVARLIQADIPLAARPFAQIARSAGMTEEAVLAAARDMKARGIIRKFGAIVRHQRVGYTHNVMVLWAVPPEGTEAAGKALSGYREVTHCYERTPPYEGRYNLFTMVHFRQETDEALLRDMAAAAGVSDFKVLRSLEEFKKNSMEYF